MTGEGNTRHAQIAAAAKEERKKRAAALDITKEIRTAAGHPVRALQYSTRKAKIFLFGKLQNAGGIERCITGQVFMKDKLTVLQWRSMTWKENGEHDYMESLNLVEYKPQVINHADLFSNITPGTL